MDKGCVVQITVNVKSEELETEAPADKTSTPKKSQKPSIQDNIDSSVTNENGDSSEEDMYSDYKYTINGNSVIIDKYTGSSDTITIPETIHGFNVTSIAGGAFSDNTVIKTLSLPNTVTNIGNGVFKGCSNLQSISISENVTAVPNNAFEGCVKLKSVALPDSLTSIGDNAFKNCTVLTGFNIPDNVTNIGTSAFENCKAITSIKVSNNVSSLGSGAFKGCSLSDVQLYYRSELTYADFVAAGMDKSIDISYFGATNMFPKVSEYFAGAGVDGGSLTINGDNSFTLKATDKKYCYMNTYAIPDKYDIFVDKNTTYIIRYDIFENTGNGQQIAVASNTGEATGNFIEEKNHELYFAYAKQSETIEFITNNNSTFVRVRFDSNSPYSTLTIKNVKMFKVE